MVCAGSFLLAGGIGTGDDVRACVRSMVGECMTKRVTLGDAAQQQQLEHRQGSVGACERALLVSFLVQLAVTDWRHITSIQGRSRSRPGLILAPSYVSKLYVSCIAKLTHARGSFN